MTNNNSYKFNNVVEQLKENNIPFELIPDNKANNNFIQIEYNNLTIEIIDHGYWTGELEILFIGYIQNEELYSRSNEVIERIINIHEQYKNN